jgi:lactoylglutathione lyase
VSIPAEAVRVDCERRQEAAPTQEIEMNPTRTSSPVVRVATVSVPVADQDRALAFYTGSLGFETRRDVATPNGGRWIELSPQGDAGTTIALIRAHDRAPAGGQTGIGLVTHDAEAMHAALAAKGIDTGEVLRWPGVPTMFEFHDPDGNGLRIIDEP